MAEEKEEKKQEEAPQKAEPKTESAKTSQYADLIGKIKSLSVVELADLVKELEEALGVSASAMVPTALPAAATPSAPGAAPQQEEKARYSVVLASAGANKIAVIKAVRELKPEMGLKDAKDFVESAPKTVLEDVPKEDAQKAKEKLEAAGATVELK